MGLLHKAGEGEIEGPEAQNGEDVRRVNDKQIADDRENRRDGIGGEDDIGCLDGNQDEEKRCRIPLPSPDDRETRAVPLGYRRDGAVEAAIKSFAFRMTVSLPLD